MENKITIEGIVSRVYQNKNVTSINLVNEVKEGRKTYTKYIDCLYFGNFKEEIKEGDRVTCTGRLGTTSYEDKKGNKHFKECVICEEIEL